MNRNRIAAAIALLLMFSLASTFAAVPVKADVIKTYCFVSVQPNPLGVGQTAKIYFQLDKAPPSYPDYTETGENWKGITINVEKPDGTTETLGPFTTQNQGAFYKTYTPTKIGTYKFQANFPGQTLTLANNNTYGSSTSNTFSLTVQEEQIPVYPGLPLPTDFWAQPIDANNREWAAIAGNWLGITSVSPHGQFKYKGESNLYSTGPETAHIAWTRELGIGGLIGGEYNSDMYYTGLWYYPKSPNPIIMNGRLYERTMSGPFHYKGTACIDLRTGEELWNKDGLFVSFGQVYFEDIGDIHGGIPLLWRTGDISDEGVVSVWYEGIATGTTWGLYDAFTGDHIRDLENAIPGGWPVMGPNGEILVYLLDPVNNWLARWNSTAIPNFVGYSTGMWQWTPKPGPPVDWLSGIDFNVTIPDFPGIQTVESVDSGVMYARGTYTQADGDIIACDVAYDLETGSQLWGPINRTVAASRKTLVMQDGVFVDWNKVTFQLNGFSAKTGQLLWTAETDKDPFEFEYAMANAAYGNVYLNSYGGNVYAFDLQTGNRSWTFYTGSSGFETPTGSWQIHGETIIGDGKIYLPTGDVEPFRPYWKGYNLICLNASTGEELWRVLGSIQTQSVMNLDMAIADGYLVGMNMYDNRLYAYGKGPSATTVTASPKISVNSDKVLVEGMVTDESSGTKEPAQTARFPHGVPAIDDEYMSAWMEYLYMQQPKPTNATGVKVTVSVLDPNNNSYEVGTTTSDANGMYKLTFTPPVPGEYTIIATFAGSGSYWSSTAETAISVLEVPAPTAPPTAPPASMADLYLVPGIVGIIVAIVVVGAVMVLMLRKR
jgi:outer membrane protein assembly factor BamB